MGRVLAESFTICSCADRLCTQRKQQTSQTSSRDLETESPFVAVVTHWGIDK